MKSMNQDPWDKLAKLCAHNAHKYKLSSRRGVDSLVGIPVPPSGALCVYNNNPYAADTKLRDDETARLRTRLNAAGIRELAYAAYPAESEYTYAMILAVGAEQLSVVREFISDVTRESHDLLQQKLLDTTNEKGK